MMADKRRILMLGHCHGVFIHPLAVHLKEKQFDVSVLELLSPGAELRGIPEPVFEEILCVPSVSPASKGEILRELLRNGINGAGERWPVRSFGPGQLRKLMVSKYNNIKLAEAWRASFQAFDLCHLHYLYSTLNEPVKHLPREMPVVLSIWGSDLMDTSGAESYTQHMAICERADIITVRSLAMREIFLSKFGRRFLRKTRLAKFGGALCDAIARREGQASREDFCARYHLDPRKIVVCLGHSGCPRDRHIELLQSLSWIAESLGELASVVMPMTYGATADYLARAKIAARESGIKVGFLTDYMTVDEVAQLRIASDVFVFLPEQDALSSAMCETLYAGNAVITGAWLPYTEFWDEGIEIFRIKDIGELPSMLLRILRDRNALSSRLAKNKQKVRPLVDYAYSIDDWVGCYDEAIASKNLQ